jgi:predicted alpha/beta-fold hydrolase
MEDQFQPSSWARNAHLQTIFGSLRLRLLGRNPMRDASREVLVPAGNGTRLLGYHSRQTDRPAKGQIILLHGWEGSADSTYVMSTGRTLYRQGYDIFRLNLKDHGGSHHLNQSLFHGALTEETAQAIDHICRLAPERSSDLIGFSLGGNFALRIALRQSAVPIRNLRQVFAISPALDPYKSTLAIDTGPSVYRLYYVNKWKRSLRKKQRSFPDLYQFNALLHHRTCMGLTVTIMTAQDDPVVSADDFQKLPAAGRLHLSLQRYGGHCGFLDPFPWGCWYERTIARILAQNEEA